ncbi:MAG: AI-2E family transporter [Acidobacteria bacterium]|nr:MAG: AI-2E family transporter [Acidobacteriota bacterium]
MTSDRNQLPGDPPDDRRSAQSRGLVLDILRKLGRFVLGQLFIAAIMTVLYAIGFFLVEVPLWWLAALLCGPFHLVPFLGAVFAVIIPIAFVLLSDGSYWTVVYVLLVVVAVQLIETLYLTPKILGKELSLHPLVIFAAVLIGAIVGGPLGALVASPLVAIGLLIWRYLHEDRVDQRDDFR